jgi:uncharacterized protein involved in exopolysaccharide biosynthesis
VSGNGSTTVSTAPDARPNDWGEISAVGVMSALLRHRGWIIATSLLVTLIVVVTTLLEPRTYTAQAVFMPQGRKTQSGISGIASQLGLNLPGGDNTQSPQFYADLVRSRTILGAVTDTTYAVRGERGVVREPLVRLLVPKGDGGPLHREKALEKLRSNTVATAGQKTGLVEVTVKAEAPDLAQQILARMIDAVNRFNLESRQSQAGAERRFTERRMNEALQELRFAENRQQRFLQGNREYDGSPSLSFEQERLSRDVSLRQEVYTTLVQAYEQAKIEEVRDTPVLTMVEPPSEPVRPDPRGLVTRAILAAVVGALLGMLPVLFRQFFASGGQEAAAQYEEFVQLRREAWRDVTRPWRPVVRLVRSRRAHTEGAR